MDPDLKDIKERRKKFKLTQVELAKKSGVSQALIAKIEAGKLDPTYTKAKKILAALDSLKEEKKIRAENILNKKILYIAPEAGLSEAMKKILKYGISQIPVIDKYGRLVGRVSESKLVETFLLKKKGIKVRTIMQEHPPIVPKSASLKVVARMLRTYPIVIVIEQGKMIGVITKSDILKVIYREKLLV